MDISRWKPAPKVRPMPRNRSAYTSSLIVLTLACAMGTVAAVQKPNAPGHVQTQPTAADGRPESRAEGMEALHNAAAASVVGALSEQFGNDRVITVKIDSTEIQIASLRDRVVSGQGRVQIGAGEDWIGFRYRTLYDTLEGSAGDPRVTLGGGLGVERLVPNDPRLVKSLDGVVSAELRKEFAGQPVRLKMGEVTMLESGTLEGGARYLRIDAQGIADFGREGSTPARVDALYDRRDNVWLRVDYELGPAVNLVAEATLAMR